MVDGLWHVVECSKSLFLLIVIPDLMKPVPYLIRGNPVLWSRIPAGVYPDGDGGGNDGIRMIVKKLPTRNKSIRFFANFYKPTTLCRSRSAA